MLIPTNQNLTTCGDLRPITLRNVDLNIISKIIIKRLGPHLNQRINEDQSAFISGRKIIDNIILVQEIIHSLSTAKTIIVGSLLKWISQRLSTKWVGSS